MPSNNDRYLTPDERDRIIGWFQHRQPNPDAFDRAVRLAEHAEQAYDEAAALRAERDRLLKCNDVLEAALKDLDGDYDGKTCPRVQCRGALKRAEAERDELRSDLVGMKLTLRKEGQVKTSLQNQVEDAEAEVERMRAVVEAAAALRAERDEHKWQADASAREYALLLTEVERMRGVVDIAIAISDADLSVYDDVPEAHDLMNQLDRRVDAYRAASSEQEARGHE
jgi:chromosome segregation ATPase